MSIQYKNRYTAKGEKTRRGGNVFVICGAEMQVLKVIAALQAFTAMLAFVTGCFGLTKALVDAGFLKKSSFVGSALPTLKKSYS